VLDRGAASDVLTIEAAKAAKQEAVPSQRYTFDFLAPHMAERVVAAAPEQLRHRLTLNHDMQAKAETLLRRHVQGRHVALSGAVMVLDHQTGAVLVSVGSPDYLDAGRKGFVDMTRAVRSPGSTLKPLIYGLAFDAGFAHPETIVTDGPVRFGSYAPQNFDNAFRGQVKVREALQLSLNIPAVTMLDAIEPSVLMARMRRTGAQPELPSGRPAGLAIGLGGVGLRLTDLMAIYASLARGGFAVPLVYDLDAEVDVAVPAPVISPVAAWYVRDILAGVAPPAGAVREGVAYKTGTSYGHRDAWAIGFDGQHTVGVWLGRADGASMPGELGAALAAPVLFDVFAAIKPKLSPLMRPPAEALTVTNDQLPSRLKVYRRPGSVTSENTPEITFPPNGASLVLVKDDVLVAKVDRGVAPFTWLANGKPVVTKSYERQADVEVSGPGFLSISVIDATGQSQAVRIVVE
jgi:penicillin-binding protein 1C